MAEGTKHEVPERVTCQSCGQRRAATLLGLSICVLCAGLVQPEELAPAKDGV